MALYPTLRLLATMTSAVCVMALLAVISAAPVDVNVKPKGTEEVLMFGNHQNAPRVKKSDAEVASEGEGSDVMETAMTSPEHVQSDESSVQGTELASESKSDDASGADDTSSRSRNEESNDNVHTPDVYDTDSGYFPYFSPYRRRRSAHTAALTAEDMTMTSHDDVRRERRSAQAALTAEDMVPGPASSSLQLRARRHAQAALTAEDMMMSPALAERKLRRAKRNIYDDDESYESEDGGDLYDELDDEEKVLLLRYIENNPEVLDALADEEERARAEEWERVRQEEAEREDVREALAYLDQLEGEDTAREQDDADPEIEYEPIVYHGEPGIFIPIPAGTAADDVRQLVDKRSAWDEDDSWQEAVEEEEREKEEEEYEAAYDKLIDLARALRQHDADKKK